MNHEKYDERLAVVRSIIEKYNLKIKDIAPLEYDPNLPFHYNNFTYKITLTTPANATSFAAAAAANTACTSSPDGNIETLILRLSNPFAEGLNQANRVRNEVAALHLARGSQHGASIIPAVYDWSPRTDGQMGWILMECKPGESLDQHFDTLSEDRKQAVTDQIADVFAVVQGATLPDTVKGYGGLTIRDDGTILSGEMTTLEGGPWDTFAEFVSANIVSQLKEADESPALGGWRENGVRERIDTLLESGLESKLRAAGVDASQRVLIHGDLTTNNILFDPATTRITGLVDYDFSYIGHPSQEFLSSFGGLSGESWDKALASRNILRREDMAGANTLQLLGQLERLLGPFRLVHPFLLGRQTAEQIAERRAQAEADLLACLEALGA